MNVVDAVNARLSVRQFLSTPVSDDQLRSLLADASRSPSGGNVQPWNAILLAGQPLADLIAAVQAR
jgi:nitroreductase